MERAERQPAGLRGSVRAEAPRWAAEQVSDGRPGQGARALCCQRLGGLAFHWGLGPSATRALWGRSLGAGPRVPGDGGQSSGHQGTEEGLL